jgi:NAD+ diphosphatase
MAFIDSPLDRNANGRADADVIKQRQEHPKARFLQLFGDAVRLQKGQLFTARDGAAEGAIYLGEDLDRNPWFAISRNTDGKMSSLRPLMVEGTIKPAQLSILAQARSLVYWHERHGFCAVCGHKTAMADAGYRRHCPSCLADHFPRTDPVVIMAVTHGDNILLGRQRAWVPGMYSAVAGFMEPGETVEQAVAREVKEETGIVVGKVSYVASQPWPFPSSLMIGCIAEAASTAISLDDKELENARWFSRADVKLMLAHKHPEGISASHPWAIAHRVISAALQ